MVARPFFSALIRRDGGRRCTAKQAWRWSGSEVIFGVQGEMIPRGRRGVGSSSSSSRSTVSTTSMWSSYRQDSPHSYSPPPPPHQKNNPTCTTSTSNSTSSSRSSTNPMDVGVLRFLPSLRHISISHLTVSARRMGSISSPDPVFQGNHKSGERGKGTVASITSMSTTTPTATISTATPTTTTPPTPTSTCATTTVTSPSTCASLSGVPLSLVDLHREQLRVALAACCAAERRKAERRHRRARGLVMGGGGGEEDPSYSPPQRNTTIIATSISTSPTTPATVSNSSSSSSGTPTRMKKDRSCVRGGGSGGEAGGAVVEEAEKEGEWGSVSSFDSLSHAPPLSSGSEKSVEDSEQSTCIRTTSAVSSRSGRSSSSGSANQGIFTTRSSSSSPRSSSSSTSSSGSDEHDTSAHKYPPSTSSPVSYPATIHRSSSGNKDDGNGISSSSSSTSVSFVQLSPAWVNNKRAKFWTLHVCPPTEAGGGVVGEEAEPGRVSDGAHSGSRSSSGGVGGRDSRSDSFSSPPSLHPGSSFPPRPGMSRKLETGKEGEEGESERRKRKRMMRGEKGEGEGHDVELKNGAEKDASMDGTSLEEEGVEISSYASSPIISSSSKRGGGRGGCEAFTSGTFSPSLSSSLSSTPRSMESPPSPTPADSPSFVSSSCFSSPPPPPVPVLVSSHENGPLGGATGVGIGNGGTWPPKRRHTTSSVLYHNKYKRAVAQALTAALNEDTELGQQVLEHLSDDSRRLLLVMGTASEFYGEDYQQMVYQVLLADRDKDRAISSTEYREWAERSLSARLQQGTSANNNHPGSGAASSSSLGGGGGGVSVASRVEDTSMKTRTSSTGGAGGGAAAAPDTTTSSFASTSTITTSIGGSSGFTHAGDSIKTGKESLVHPPIPHSTSPSSSTTTATTTTSSTTGMSTSTTSSSTSTSSVVLPRSIYSRLLLTAGLPFLAFGLLDNSIFILAGEAIDRSLSILFGFSSLAAAGFGGVVSGVAGIQVHGLAERWVGKVAPEPPLTPAQRQSDAYEETYRHGSTIGMVVGLLLGMTPLLLINTGGGGSGEEEDGNNGISGNPLEVKDF